MNIRICTTADLDFLQMMLFEACFWDPAADRSQPAEFMQLPVIKKILHGWGRQADFGLIAETDNVPIGAAWYRLWTKQDHSFGFVDENTPELGIALLPAYRSKGFGRALLSELIDFARRQNYPALSLSVDPENFARKLYESLGFVPVGKSGTSVTYLLKL